jgi:NAD(P)-dependent dehydrogenase (short-subunit alcohol dehydrogenase family)
MLAARAALPVMEPASAFVFISSIAARSAGGGLMSYAVSKSGMESLMRHVAAAGKDRAIRANIVMPGRIDTGLARDHNHQSAAQIASGVPIGRAGTGWDIAYATLFLLSGEATYITGQILAVDGGSASL